MSAETWAEYQVSLKPFWSYHLSIWMTFPCDPSGFWVSPSMTRQTGAKMLSNPFGFSGHCRIEDTFLGKEGNEGNPQGPWVDQLCNGEGLGMLLHCRRRELCWGTDEVGSARPISVGPQPQPGLSVNLSAAFFVTVSSTRFPSWPCAGTA